jgi:glutaredoxin
MNYIEKLKDPRWQKKRLKIFERDDWQCTHCHSTEKTLHVHHIDYEKGLEPWEYKDEMLQTLCEECHTSLKGLRSGSVLLHEGNGWGYDGRCPKCNSNKIKEKGSWDKCLDCGFVISFY